MSRVDRIRAALQAALASLLDAEGYRAHVTE